MLCAKNMGYKYNEMTSMMRTYGTLSAHQRPTVGDTKTSVVGYDHIGWLMCDGRTLSVAQYYSLFQVIGYAFGGSDISFNLPNAAGRVAGMVGTGPGSVSWALGDVSGAYDHTLTIPEMPAHTHTSNATGSAASGPGLISVSTGGDNTATDFDATPGELNIGNTAALTINSTGGSLPHNNLQPTIFMGNMFIYAGKPELGAWPYKAALAPPML